MAANARVDPILIACLVDSSAALLYEWNQILQAYISPLLQRIAAIHNNARNNRLSQETIKIGFVSYSDRNVHPNPILARRFFAPVSLITRELKDEPTSLGLGHTASSSDAKMAVLDGYVAVLEMFDAVAETRPLPPQIVENTELPPYEPTLYLLHIAAIQPDDASKPIWNQNRLLDDVTWSSLPAEILKRNIRHNMILINPILQLQEFYKNIHRNPENHGIPVLKSSHKLLFFNMPSDVKTIPHKRAAPDSVDVKPNQASSPKDASAPVPPPNPATLQTATPYQASAMPDIQTQANQSQPSQRAQASSAQLNQSQLHSNQRPAFDLNRLKMILFSLENEIQNAKATLERAKASGKPKSDLDAIENDINLKTQQKTRAVQVYQIVMHRSQAANVSAQQSQPTNTNTQISKISTHIPSNANNSTVQSNQNTIAPNSFPNMPPSTRPAINAQMEKLIAERVRPPVVAAAPTGVQLQHSPPQPQLQPLPQQSQPQPQSQVQPQPQPQSQPQPQPQLQPQSQPHFQPQLPPHSQLHLQPQSQSQLHSQQQSQLQPQSQQLQFQPQLQPQLQAGVAVPPPSQATSQSSAHLDIFADKPALANLPRRWQGLFAWSIGVREVAVRVALYAQDTPTLRPETWPQRLRFVQGHTPINSSQIQAWCKEKSAVMSLVTHAPVPGNDEASVQNHRLFKLVRGWCQNKNMLLYSQFDLFGAPQGSGALLFPLLSLNTTLSDETFVCMIFNKSPLPVEVLGPQSMASSQAQGGPSTSTAMHNIPNLTSDNFLQQQRMQALANYQKTQELAQQANAQRNTMQNLVGVSMASFGGVNGPNVNQLPQAGQQPLNPAEQNVMISGGMNIAPQAQGQLAHRQVGPGTTNLTPAQIAQLLQFGMNRNLDANGQ